MNRYSHVFQPLKLRKLVLKNRLECTPFVPALCDPEGGVTQGMLDFIRMQARSGVANIVVGSITDSDRCMCEYADANFMEDRFLIGLAQLVDEAHKYGACISYELSHSGRCDLPSLREKAQADGMTEERPIPKKEAMIDEMTRDDMEWFIQRQVQSCLRAKKAGFDIIFIHAGHNAGLGSCLSPLTNHRTDEYGGSVENRIRFPLEVIKAVREAVGDMPIEVRASARDMVDGGMEVEDTIAFFQAIEPYIDLAHVSNGNMFFEEGRIYTSPMYTMEHKQNVPYSQRVKEALQIPVTVVGNIFTLQDAEEILASGQADMVGFCRSVLADPDLFRKAAEGREEDVRPCLRCMDGCGLIFHGLPARCAVNPTLGRESDCRLLRPIQQKKKVVVVGGGPAGMQAAQTLTARGHEVVLFEKSDHLGGLLCDASQVSFKQLMRDYLAWNVRTTLRCGAKIYFETEATPERIAAEHPDEVIVATGSTYLRPPIPGIDNPNVVMLRDAETGAVQLGERIIICGGGLSGVEAAVDFGRQGKNVTVIDMIPTEEFCKSLFFFAYEALFKEVKRAGVTLLGGRKIRRFDGNGVEVEHDGVVERMEADQIVLALGLRSNRTLADQLLADNPFHTNVVGDAAKVANLRHANSTAYYAAIGIE